MKKLLVLLYFAAFLPFYIIAQDECNTSVNIPVQMYSDCGEMALQSVDLGTATPSTTTPDPTCAGFSSGNTNDLWYSFTVPAGVNTMAFHMFNSSNKVPVPNASSPGMAVYTGPDCANLALLDCFASNAAPGQNGEIRFRQVNGLTPGTTVWMRVWDENNLDQHIFIAASVNLNFPEDSCATPATLTNTGCNILSKGDDIQAPETCGWNTSDNTVFYNFTVTASDPQPYSITAEAVDCYSNGGTPTNTDVQFAIYSWNGVDCTDIGGSPSSSPPNNSGSYWGCANGTGMANFTNNIPPGDYLIALEGATDSAGNVLCSYSFSSPFIQDTLNVDLNITNEICGEQGSAYIDVLQSCSGDPVIAWSTGDTAKGISNLAAGSYSVTVTDTIGTCTDTIINFNVLDTGNIDVNISTTGDVCSGPFDATAHVIGADDARCSFQWNTNPQQNTQTATGLTPGNYTVTADFGTCQATETVNIDYSEVDFNINYDSEVCGGETTTADLSVTSGASPYSYSWTTGETTQDIDIATSGNYGVTVMDSYGCTNSDDIDVTVYPMLLLDADITDNQCYGNIIGEIEAEVAGGTPPYDYNWTNTSVNDSVISNLTEGIYGVTVTDANGCTIANNWMITEPEELTYNFNKDTSICEGENVTLNINAQGGTPPYSYIWNGIPTSSSSRNVMPDSTVTFVVSVMDDNGCTTVPEQSTIEVSQTMDIDIKTTDSKCYNSCDGIADADITGGIQPFNYSWNSNNDVENGLCAGNYELTVTDDVGCEQTQSFEIEEPNPLTAQIYTKPATCPYTNDGMVWVDAQGGTKPYKYFWDNGMSSDSIYVGGGNHYVTVTDTNSCVLELQANVYAPDPFIIEGISNKNICINGKVNYKPVVLGGSGTYDYRYTTSGDTVWYNRNFSVDSLEEDTDYKLTVYDTEGCSASKDFTVSVYPEIEIDNFFAEEDTVCAGEPVKVHTEIYGGNGGPYQVYLKDHGIIPSPYISYPQESGYYRIKVEDLCTTPPQRDSIYIHVWPTPNTNFEADLLEGCPPLTVNFNKIDSIKNATYQWNFGDEQYSYGPDPTHVYRNSGYYDVLMTIEDEHECEKIVEKENFIRVYPEPEIEFYYRPTSVSMLDPLVAFYNITENTDSLYWYFGDGDTLSNSSDRVTHYYNSKGEYNVRLVGENTYGCLDSANKILNISEEYNFNAPTAFTPNNDQHNDCFSVCGEGIDQQEFSLKIYNRWGELVFKTEEYNDTQGCGACNEGSWDGTLRGDINKGGNVLTEGIYYWVCTYKDISGLRHEYSGEVMLIK